MRAIVKAYVMGLSLLAFSATVFCQQVAKTIPSSNAPAGLIGFLEFRPYDYGSQKHPLIIFLHGIGERGDGTSQINAVANNAIPYYCAHGATMSFKVKGQTSSFVVLSPQLSSEYGYWPTFYVKEMIKYAKANLQIDPNRIYITGLSLGGGGVWRMITDTEDFNNSFDGTIAAAAPVCGTQEESDDDFCSTIAANHLPIWAFHCVDDGVVGVGSTEHAEILSENCHVSPAPIFTYYQSGGHAGAWINAYDTGHITTTVENGGQFKANPNLYEWFLSNTRSNSNPGPGYTAPVADAGQDQSITLPASSVTLKGKGSGTNGATIKSYSWTKTSGPAAGKITKPSSASSAVTGLAEGNYVFTFTVTDNHDMASSANVNITVNAAEPPANQAPIANAGADISITLPENAIVLDGSGSSDPDGNITAYRWTQTNGPAGSAISNRDAATTKVTGLNEGVYTFVLQVTDNGGAVASASVKVTVNPATPPPPGNPPVADAGPSITITLPASSVALDASASSQTEGYIDAYHWTQTAGPEGAVIDNPDAMKTTVNGLTEGVYTFVLQVTDNNGVMASAEINITVDPDPAANTDPGSNAYPVANPGPDMTVTLPVNSVTLNGLQSYDPDGYLTAYRWTQIEGPDGAVMDSRDAGTTIVTGLTAGTYTFVLQVKNNRGLEGSARVVITVNPDPGTTAQPIGYIKQSVGPYQACDDASTSGRIPIYGQGIANGNIVYLDAAQTSVFDGGYNWFSFMPVLGGAVTESFAVFPDGSIRQQFACTAAAVPPADAANLLGYIKMSVSPYQACDDASSDGRIPIYGNSIANGSYLYTDEAMTQKFDGGWNWYSFTPTLGGPVTCSFAVYPIGSMGQLMSCSADARVAQTERVATTATAAGRMPVTETVGAAGALSLNLYPNPVRNSATIRMNSATADVKTIRIYNASGVLASTYTWQTSKGSNTYTLQGISGLPAGLYIADIRDSRGNTIGKLKFVRQ